MATAVGIDLGTTNTVVAAVRDGVVVTLSDGQGERLMPSVISFHPSGSVLVGRDALGRRLTDPTNTIYSVKRLIGRTWNSQEVQRAAARLPFQLQEGPKGGTVVVARRDTFSLPEISAFVLRQAKALAEAALGDAVERAVITVPANFNDLQRAATKSAGRLAGLEVLRILNEPTAAALAYGSDDRSQERVAVYDLGGGTFDVTILDLLGNVFEVLATAGDTALGGDDIDELLAARMSEDMLKKHRFDANAAPFGIARLRMLGEELKRELSTATEHGIEAADIIPGDRGTYVPWRYRMTRPELEATSLPLVSRTLKVCEQALALASLSVSDIDRVLLVGGATRMPLVARRVEEFFGRAAVMNINPDEVVALGAAIQADLLDRSRTRAQGPIEPVHVGARPGFAPLPEGSPHGLPELPSLPVVHPLAPAPVGKPVPPPVPRRAADEATRAKEPSARRDEFLPGMTAKPLVFDVPDLAMPPFKPSPPKEPAPTNRKAPPPPAPAPPPPPTAPSAPVLRSPEVRRGPLLIDVTPLSLSVETVGGFCDVLIEANTPVPCDKTRTFGTASDGQTTVLVRIAQGESRRFADNTLLGEVQLSDLPPAARGEAPVGVTFEIDADGILNVRACDVKTGREAVANLKLVGAHDDPKELAAMKARQNAHPIARPPAAR